MIIMLLGLLIFLFIENTYGIYTFGFGAAFFTIIRLLALVQHRNGSEISRLPQIRVLSAAALLGAAYLMYIGSTSWSVLLLVTAVLEVYVTFRQK